MKRITSATILAAASIFGVSLGAQTAQTPVLDTLPTVQPDHGNGAILKSDTETNIANAANLPVPVFHQPPFQNQVERISAAQAELGDLPLPRMHIDPAHLSTANALQVAAATQGSHTATGNHGNPARSFAPIAKAPVAPEASDKKTASSQSVSQTTVRPRAPAYVSSVRPPAPLQRSTAPVMVDPVKTHTPVVTATTLPLTLPSRTEAVGSVADPHSLPEYHLVQLPAQVTPPMPPQSLPIGSQDFNGTQGQILAIKLSGRGWIYTGTGQTPAGVSYIEKSVQPDVEQFRFRLDSVGRQVLQFQRQDVASGLLDRQEAAVTVQPRANGISTGQMQTISIVQPTSTQYQPEYQIPEDASREIPNASSRSDSQAVNLVTATLPASVPLPTDAPGTFSLAIQNDQSGQSAAALALYEKVAKDWPSWEKTDEVLFRTARLLESASNVRDVKRAYDLFIKIQNEYPYGPWADQSKERARYISRAFFRP